MEVQRKDSHLKKKEKSVQTETPLKRKIPEVSNLSKSFQKKESAKKIKQVKATPSLKPKTSLVEKPSKVDQLENKVSEMADMLRKLMIVNQNNQTKTSSSVNHQTNFKNPKSRRCYLCGGRDHMVSACTSPKESKAEPSSEISQNSNNSSETSKKWSPKAEIKESLEPIQKWVPKRN